MFLSDGTCAVGSGYRRQPGRPGAAGPLAICLGAAGFRDGVETAGGYFHRQQRAGGALRLGFKNPEKSLISHPYGRWQSARCRLQHKMIWLGDTYVGTALCVMLAHLRSISIVVAHWPPLDACSIHASQPWPPAYLFATCPPSLCTDLAPAHHIQELLHALTPNNCPAKILRALRAACAASYGGRGCSCYHHIRGIPSFYYS